MVKDCMLSLQDQKQDEDVHSHNFYSKIVLEVLAKAIKQEKETNSIQIEKRRSKNFLFTDNMVMITYVKKIIQNIQKRY